MKRLRLAFWLLTAFFQKHLLLITVSFVLSAMSIALYINFSSEILSIFTTEEKRIGIDGTYTLTTLPENVISHITTSLLIQKDDGTYESRILEDFRHNTDYTKFTFRLREGLTYTDGTPFQSRDIPYIFRDVKVEYPDERTIIYTLKRPFPHFYSFLTNPIYSRRSQRGVEGEYLITSVKYSPTRDFIESLALSPLVATKPKLLYRFYRNETDLITAFKLDEIDSFTTTSELAYRNLITWPNVKGSQTSTYNQIVSVFFNTRNPPLDDRDFRTAILSSFPTRDLQAKGTLAVSPISPLSWLYDSTLERAPENPVIGKSILANFFESTPSANLRIVTSFDFLDIAGILKDIITSTGGTATVDVSGARTGDDFDMLVGLWNIPSDINQYFVWHSSQKDKNNITGYSNPRVDKLLEDFRATDSATMQKKLMSDFQRQIAQDVPAAFLYYPYIYTISRK
jgi:peptide/nickel transport system substrate-binding protein